MKTQILLLAMATLVAFSILPVKSNAFNMNFDTVYSINGTDWKDIQDWLYKNQFKNVLISESLKEIQLEGEFNYIPDETINISNEIAGVIYFKAIIKSENDALKLYVLSVEHVANSRNYLYPFRYNVTKNCKYKPAELNRQALEYDYHIIKSDLDMIICNDLIAKTEAYFRELSGNN